MLAERGSSSKPHSQQELVSLSWTSNTKKSDLLEKQLQPCGAQVAIMRKQTKQNKQRGTERSEENEKRRDIDQSISK